jgi:hypothetical protein
MDLYLLHMLKKEIFIALKLRKGSLTEKKVFPTRGMARKCVGDRFLSLLKYLGTDVQAFCRECTKELGWEADSVTASYTRI